MPHTRAGHRRLDEYELMDHYRLWRQDIDLAADLGVSTIRYGIPWYRVNPRPGQFDWSWTDAVLEYLVGAKGLTPIVDLMHYGTPLWLDNHFVNASYPRRVAEYAGRFAERYAGLVRHYTPLNEPAVTAASSGAMPVARSSFAKVTRRIELAVATPMDMMAPIKLGTLNVVCVRKSAQTIPQNAPGSAQMMMKGSSQD